MAVKWLDAPVAISDGTDATWTERDLTSLITAGSVGVILQVRNAHASTGRDIGVRHANSTDDFFSTLRQQCQTYIAIGLHTGDLIDIYQATSDINWFVVAEFDGNDESFETDGAKFTTTGGSWEAIDLTTLLGGDAGNATGIFGNALTGASNDHFNVRDGASTDDRNNRDLGKHSGWATGLDTTDDTFDCHADATFSAAGGAILVQGWTTGQATWAVNRTEITNSIPTNNTYGDLSAVTSPANGAIIELSHSGGVDKTHARAKGTSHDPGSGQDSVNDQFLYIMTEVDGSRVAEARRDNSVQRYWEAGVLEESVGGGVDIAVPLGTIAMAGLLPTVASGKNVVVPLATISLSDLVPAVGTGALVDAPLDALTLSDLVPAVATGGGAIVPLAAISISDLLPSVAAGASVAVPLDTITLSDLVPAVGTGVQIVVPLNNIVMSGFAPEILFGITVTVPLDTVALTGLIPDVGAGKNVLVPLATLSVNGLAPAVGTSALVLVPADTITISGLVPGVATGGGALVPLGTITMSGHVPTITASGAVEAALRWIDQNAHNIPALRNARALFHKMARKN